MRTDFIAAARPDRARSGALPRDARYRKQCGSMFDPRRREFIPVLGGAAVYPSPPNGEEKNDAALRPRHACVR
jgi:hypothetical protein